MDAEIKSMNRKYETILIGEDMKKCCISMWSVVVLSLGLFSCGGGANQQAEAEEKLEVEAVIAGDVARNMLTDELKMEVTQFLKDMPISDLVYQLATGEVQVALANTDFMLPVSRVSDLNTRAQQARACGIYFADMNVLKVLGKPTAEVEQVLLQLTTDLNVPFVVDVMGTEVPEHATREELSHFMKQQEDKLIDVMMENGIEYDGAVGVSAGAAFGCNYKSRQIGRVIRYNTKYCNDRRFSGIGSLIKTGNIYNTDFAYGEDYSSARCLFK